MSQSADAIANTLEEQLHHMIHQHIQIGFTPFASAYSANFSAPGLVEPGIEPKDPLSSEPKASVKESPIIPSDKMKLIKCTSIK